MESTIASTCQPVHVGPGDQTVKQGDCPTPSAVMLHSDILTIWPETEDSLSNH